MPGRTLVGWLDGWLVTLHTGPEMGLLGARVQLAGIEPPGTSQSERKIAPKVQLRSERERRCQSEKPDPIGLAGAAAIP